MASSVPSLKTISKFALGSVQVLLGSGATVLGGTPATCSNSQLSCHNTTAVANTCCFNAPGGQLLQTQFWDTNPPTGPSDAWTIHGLWPDNCDGTYEASCDSKREYTNISAILNANGKQSTLSYMNTYWKDYQGNDETFWAHEWGKHGTCISTYEPSCYSSFSPTEEVADFFEKTVTLFKALPSYQWLSEAGIIPSSSSTYTSAQIQSALSAKHGYQVTLGCSSGALNEIWYHYNVKGSVQTGEFVATDPDGTKSTCPSTGVKYLPKGSSGGGTKTTSIGPAPTGAPFSGKGYLNGNSGGSQKGCIISAGTWYSSGTCATFTATSSGSGFTLSSSKGPCAIQSGTLTCASGTTATVFTSDNGKLASGGSSTFYADSVPSGSTQQKVYTSSHATSLTITWQAV
ncbi:ribonuclease M [Pseudovirgaria hyperparasitica]|uniref:Ribonuclease T2-like n=1 Tax=Pseudovirgaria hyperparasitica TaxID=470096 RepID=A0A6A6W8A3_9PEZI|nr:ribonuclease M [Pseudovirgaria hyperparasitica]KAF2758254.1 ribonuclease M [Pseudovirgaria hyperparasitica]